MNKDNYHGAILIQSVQCLTNADWFGKSDPYIIIRMGKHNSDWDQKSKITERKSKIIFRNLNPVFQFAFYYYIPEKETPNSWEIHIRIYDKDLLSKDDFIGETHVLLNSLIFSNP